MACTIDSVTIDGCRKDRNIGPCKLKRNVNAAINIDFTPDFDGDDITLMAYALVSGIEKSFPDMDENACNHMPCPVTTGIKQSYSFGLKLAPSYPLVSTKNFYERRGKFYCYSLFQGMFNVRFLVKKAGQPKCCFVTKLRIEK